jgi:hypothetical protein
MLRESPRLLSLALAGALCGLSGKAFRRLYVLTGRINYRPDEYFETARRYIRRRELEAVLGRPITLDELQAADLKMARKRLYMRRYRRERA